MKAAAKLDAPVVGVRALAPDQIRLSWLPVTGAKEYRVERALGRSKEWEVVGTTPKTVATNSNLRGNRLYRYHVIAIDADGQEAASEILSIRPNAALEHASMRAEKIANLIENFRAQQTEFVAANVDIAEDLDFRRVVRRQQNAFAAQMLELGVVYRPMAVESLLPPTLSSVPHVSSVPPTVTITVRNASELAVGWTAVSGGLSYKIERSVDAGTTWSSVAYSTGTRFVDVGLSADTSYQYRVSVITSTDTSSPSIAVTGVTNQVAPAGLAAVAANATTVNLSWSIVANATSYRIERSINNTTWTALTPSTPLTGTDTTYADASGAAGTTYYYRIVTVNGSRSSSASDPVAATTLVAVPTLTATALSGTRVNLSWTAGATAFEYMIDRSDDAGTTWDTIATSSAAHFVDGSLTANTAYQYRVSSTNAGGTTAPSTVVDVTTLLATVTGFAATPSATADSVTLDWTAVDDATTYRIDRSTNQTTWSTLTTSLAGTDVTFDDTTVSPGTTYSYRIVAVNTAGTGAVGDSVNALVRPATPTGVATTAPTVDSVTITWNAVPTATSYLVEKSDDAGTTWTTLGTPTARTITDTGLAADLPLQYRVSAVNATGASDPTSVASITTAPATPAGLATAFDDATNKITLTWTAVTDADTYVIERSIGNGAWTTLTPSTPLTGTDATYDDTASITAGTSYRYRISASNANGTSLASAAVTQLTEPAVPTLSTTTVAATSVTMSWTASTSATAYTLQISDDAGTTWTDAYTGSALTYTKTGLTSDTPYSFQVLATNATGDSDYSTGVALTTLLDAPANLAGTTPNGTSIVLTWDAVTNATGYLIERSANAGSTWTTVVPNPALTGTDVTFTDTGLTANTAYRYRINAINANGTSAPSTAANITTRVGTPTGLAAATTSATVLAVSWTATAGATSYKLESSADGGTTWADVVTQAGVTYSNTGLTANTTYSYRVTAIGTAGAGVVSAVATGRTLLAAPGGFAVAAPTNTTATLTWTASTGATGYKIEKSINGGTAWTVLAASTALTGTDVTYTDTGLTANTSYQYRLSGISAVGTSVATSAATVLTRTNATVVSGTVVSSTAVNLSWTAVTGATSYVVQKSSDAGTTWTSAGSPTGVTLAATGLTSYTNYLFRVYAANASGNSAASNSLALRTLIAAPTGLATTQVSANEIRLSWTAVTGATGYKLERAVGTGAFAAVTPSTPFNGSSASYIDSNLLIGTVYKYRISSINAIGTSTPSSELATVTKPAAPVVTSTTPSTTQINLSWAAITTATGYKVEISNDGGSTWTIAATPSGTTYNATGLDVDSAYKFRVSAVNASGAGAASTVVATRTLLPATSGLTLLDTSSTSVTVAWTPQDNATAYILERSINGTTWTTVVATPALSNSDSSYEDTGLAGGTTYQYRISGSNAAGRSAASSTVSGTTLAAAPTLTATVVSGTTINLAWTASATATSYRLERSANSGATWTTIASPTGTSFSDTSVQAARNYSYRVSAVNAAGAGDKSAEVAAATLLVSPTNFTATTASATAVNLSWTTPAGATGYKIERSTDTNTWTVTTQSPVLAGSATFFANTGLTAGTDYYYRITATAGTIVSPTSPTVRATTVLAAPTGLAATAASTTTINLAWTATTSFSRTGFKLQRSPNGTNGWTTIATPAATATGYSNTGLTSGTRYFYRLVAVSLAGDSAPGAVVNATTK